MSERLIVVSNRLPLTLKHVRGRWRTERSTGGLATAMDPILKQTSGLWIGSAGAPSDDPARAEAVREWAERDRFFTVDLPEHVAHLYYEGFSNQTLWPLFHHFPNLVQFEPDAWRAYVDANRRFRDVVARHYEPGDLIWVHDYHLMALPRLLRDALPDAVIGWFLHIPFPSSEAFRILPRRGELLEGLLGADLLAFHTHSHLQHFRSSLLRVLGRESALDSVDLGGRIVRLDAMPIGIAAESFGKAARSAEGVRHREQIQRQHEGRKIIIAVDRLDYTKGIPERLRAYRRLLAGRSELRGKLVLFQIAVPSRERIGTYSGLQRRVHELISEINGEFGTPDWTPVVYIRRGMPRAQLAATYAAGDVCWVGSLRDGMNLVAKEYIAAKGADPGALVLSEFAGANEDLGAEAYSINPYDEERTADTVARALTADPEELRRRMTALYHRVVRNNVFAWAERFVAALRRAGSERASRPGAQTAALPEAEVLAAFRRARSRALFIDYDGTLIGFAGRPEHALPTAELIELVRRLASTENQVTIISGRRRSDLETWFGGVPNLWLAAEHGGLVRTPGGNWEPLHPVPAEWKDRVRPILEHFCDRTPGALIEEKELSLAWHYRLAEPEFGEWLAKELLSTLDGLLADTDLRAAAGAKLVEVRPIWVNKGQAVRHILERLGHPEFEFAIGDDRTDEDMFAVMDPDAWTVHVGPGPTRARFSVPGHAAVRTLLDNFAVTPSAAGTPINREGIRL